MKNEELRQQFHLETGEKWQNTQGEPDIDYVLWLEKRIIARQYDTTRTLLFSQKDIEEKLDELGLNGKYIASYFKIN